MWALDIADALDGYNVFAIYADERCETGVYGSVVDFLRCGIELRYDLADC